jgi:hypothetical protein
MAHPHAADDFATIRARMEELRWERSPAPPSEEDPRAVGRFPGSLEGATRRQPDRSPGAARNVGVG